MSFQKRQRKQEIIESGIIEAIADLDLDTSFAKLKKIAAWAIKLGLVDEQPIQSAKTARQIVQDAQDALNNL